MVAPAGTADLQAQLAAAKDQERDALKMAEELDRLGAPERDVRYALERAQAAREKLQLLERTAQTRQS